MYSTVEGWRTTRKHVMQRAWRSPGSSSGAPSRQLRAYDIKKQQRVHLLREPLSG